MKNMFLNIKTKAVLLTFLLIGTVQLLFAQFNSELPTLTDFADLEKTILAAVILVGGYLSKSIPLIAKIPSTAWRVFAIALVAGTMTVSFGWASVSETIFVYFGTTNLYALILKFFLKNGNDNIPDAANIPTEYPNQ